MKCGRTRTFKATLLLQIRWHHVGLSVTRTRFIKAWVFVNHRNKNVQHLCCWFSLVSSIQCSISVGTDRLQAYQCSWLQLSWVQVGLQLLIDEGSVFECYDTLQDVVWFSEVGASRAILKAGYSIDCLMLKYVGVDWHNKSNWDCNAWCVCTHESQAIKSGNGSTCGEGTSVTHSCQRGPISHNGYGLDCYIYVRVICDTESNQPPAHDILPVCH